MIADASGNFRCIVCPRSDLHHSGRLIWSLIHFSRRGTESFHLLAFVGWRRSQIIEIIANAIIGENISRDHLGMDLAGTIAQLKIIHGINSERIGERQRAESFFDNHTFIRAAGTKSGSEKVSDDGATHGRSNFSGLKMRCKRFFAQLRAFYYKIQ